MSQCECTACGEIFRSETGFDKHRIGKYTIPNTTRKCLTKRQMINRGMIKKDGVWLTSLMKHNPYSKPSLRKN